MTTSHIHATRTANVGVGLVAVTAAVISFSHVRAVAARSGESNLTAWLLPVSIDGAVVAAVSVLLADSRAGRRPAALNWLLLTLGLSASLAANVASAEPTATARAVAAWPPIALALGIEVLAGLARRAEPEVVPLDAGRSEPATELRGIRDEEKVDRLSPDSDAAADRQRSMPTLAGDAAGRPLRDGPAMDDGAAVTAIRELDRAAPFGRASRLEIQKMLGCGGSGAARLAELARQTA